MVVLQNEFLCLTINPFGAQPQSLRHNGREYLWQGHPDIWADKAPVLFPIIGRMNEEQYTVDGKHYDMGIHGFAPTSFFSIVEQSETAVTFHLTDTAETQACYPYAFAFSVEYRLEGNTIHKIHTMENMDRKTLHYEVGGHDGYIVPFSPEETMDDCHIHFPGLTQFSPYEFDEQCRMLPKAHIYEAPGGMVPLKPSTYGIDCVIFDELPEHKCDLVDSQGIPRIRVRFEDFPYVTLWTKTQKEDTNYVCIEPWSSLPDATFVSAELSDKVGIRTLQPGQVEILSYSIEIEPDL